jgi:aspartyl/asparaginyl beta-hydroxylase (cupin superfamily)
VYPVASPDVAALVQSLAPGPFRDLLQAAQAHEARGETRAAAATWRTALQALPPHLPPALRPVLEHAKAAVQANDAALEGFLAGRLEALRRRHDNARQDRFDRCLDTLLRKRRVYRPAPSFMYFPHLPAIEFYDRADFPWLDAIEAATADIRAELIEVLADGPTALEPYVSVEGAPQDRWRELNNSRRWGVFYLWRAGVPVAENLARCPKTARALAAWPQCELMGTGPSAVFSILDARTRIPPHVGVNNARLICHLPLIVPPGCGFRVGAETRAWTPGEAFVFDDTIEHEAWNTSDQPRAVLIFDTWNPYLTDAERELVTALTAGVGEYYGELPSYASGAAL